MKKFIYLLLGFAIISCQEEQKADYVLLSGTIENLDTETIKVSGNSFSTEITVTNNTLSDTLHIEKNGYYTMRMGRKFAHIYFAKGDVLNFTVDAKDAVNTLAFTGVGADINSYMVAKNKKDKEFIAKIEGVYALNESAFLDKINGYEEEQLTLLNNAKLNADFTKMETKSLYFGKVQNFEQYEKFHSSMIKNPEFKVSENFPKELEKIDFTNEEDYKTFSKLRILAMRYYGDRLAKAYEITNDYSLAFEESLKGLENGAIKDAMISQFSRLVVTPHQRLEETYQFVMDNTTNAKYKEGYTKTYNSLKHLAKGNESPKFNYENYKGGKTSLDDLKGKYVYIDMWATWCAPCKKEIPALKRVEKQFHGKNIAFVSISVDRKKDYDTWRKMIEDEELGGIQLMADNDRNSKFYHDYEISGIPRFILIDPEGKIISADAPRPSNPRLVEKFNSLL